MYVPRGPGERGCVLHRTGYLHRDAREETVLLFAIHTPTPLG